MDPRDWSGSAYSPEFAARFRLKSACEKVLQCVMHYLEFKGHRGKKEKSGGAWTPNLQGEE